jgi:hypothetical protein
VLKTDYAVIATYEYVGDELPAPGDIITVRNALAVRGPDGTIPAALPST